MVGHRDDIEVGVLLDMREQLVDIHQAVAGTGVNVQIGLPERGLGSSNILHESLGGTVSEPGDLSQHLSLRLQHAIRRWWLTRAGAQARTFALP